MENINDSISNDVKEYWKIHNLKESLITILRTKFKEILESFFAKYTIDEIRKLSQDKKDLRKIILNEVENIYINLEKDISNSIQNEILNPRIDKKIIQNNFMNYIKHLKNEYTIVLEEKIKERI